MSTPGQLAAGRLIQVSTLMRKTARVTRGRSGRNVLALCEYGFTIRGLHRLQVDTLADNMAMIQAASRAGFVLEGRLRRAAWVSGEVADEVILGLLAADWASGRDRQPGGGAALRS